MLILRYVTVVCDYFKCYVLFASVLLFSNLIFNFLLLARIYIYHYYKKTIIDKIITCFI